MQEQIVGFEVAKLAKDKEFDWLCKYAYDINKKLFHDSHCNTNWNDKVFLISECSAPTQALLQKWLREKCNIRVFVVPIIFDNYSFRIYYPHPITKSLEKKYFEIEIGFKTYEEALEAGLFEALKLIKNEN